MGIFATIKTAHAASVTFKATVGDSDSEDTVKVDWQLATDNAFSNITNSQSNQSVTLSSGTGTYTNSLTLSPTTTTTYYWRVRAKDNHNAQSDWSTTRSFTINVAVVDNSGGGGGSNNDVPPTCSTSCGAVPRIIVPNPNASISAGNNSLTVSWVSQSNYNYVNVYCSTTPNFIPSNSNLIATITNNNISSYVYSNLTNNIKYYCRIIAVDGNGNQSSSSQLSATPRDTQPPAQITDLTATSLDKSIQLNWTNPADTSQVKIYRFITSDFDLDSSTLLTTLNSSSSQSYTDTNVNVGQTYYYVVVAVDDSGNQSPESNEVSSTPQNNSGAIATVKNVKVNNTCQSNTLSFDNPTDNTTVLIYRSEDGLSIGQKIGQTTQESYTDKNISSNQKYYYTLIVSNNDSGEKSSPVTISTISTFCGGLGGTINQILTPISQISPIFSPPVMVAAIVNNTSKAAAFAVPILISSLLVLQGLIGYLLNAPSLSQAGLVGSVSDLLLSPIRFLGYLPKKRKTSWGVVQDSTNGLPIVNAFVRLVEGQSQRTVARTISDQQGQYGFVVDKPGQYFLATSANMYLEDKSGNFSITDTNVNPTNLNINLDPAKQSIFLRLINRVKVFSLITVLINIVRVPILVVGSLLAIYNLISFRNETSLIIVVIYLIFWIAEILLNRIPKNYGVVLGNKKPLSRAIVRLYKVVENNKFQLSATTVTDSKGRYRFMCPQGYYVIEVMSIGYQNYKSDQFHCRKSKIPNLTINLKENSSQTNFAHIPAEA